MSANKINVSEFADSLTGFEEVAMEQKMGVDFYDEAAGIMRKIRALAFVHFKREGQDDKSARQSAMGLPSRDLSALFDLTAAQNEDLVVDESGKEADPNG